jgi:hypothetical protein
LPLRSAHDEDFLKDKIGGSTLANPSEPGTGRFTGLFLAGKQKLESTNDTNGARQETPLESVPQDSGHEANEPEIDCKISVNRLNVWTDQDETKSLLPLISDRSDIKDQILLVR